MRSKPSASRERPTPVPSTPIRLTGYVPTSAAAAVAAARPDRRLKPSRSSISRTSPSLATRSRLSSNVSKPKPQPKLRHRGLRSPSLLLTPLPLMPLLQSLLTARLRFRRRAPRPRLLSRPPRRPSRPRHEGSFRSRVRLRPLFLPRRRPSPAAPSPGQWSRARRLFHHRRRWPQSPHPRQSWSGLRPLLPRLRLLPPRRPSRLRHPLPQSLSRPRSKPLPPQPPQFAVL
jgi:hypothetical protein